MASDAKIGLLLGLVFIFLIAFIINGLPRFRKAPNNSELTTNMANSQSDPPGIAAREREVIINPAGLVGGQFSEAQSASMAEQDPRFTMLVPDGPAGVRETNQMEQTIGESSEDKSVKPPVPKIYVVKEGDNLSIIAQKCYGSEEGNKRINVVRIFEANRKLLKSADEIYVGQKLIIPPLSASLPKKSKIDSLLVSSMLEKVESIGRRHLTTDSEAKQSGWYIVKTGDSLWRIADEQLGDGSRYKEIAKLNTDVLDDEDRLSVGMRLRMPAQ
jgi:nucleoid-associated protein YgaU